MPTFFVLRVNADPSDTYAVPLEGDIQAAAADALDNAIPNYSDTLDWVTVDAPDAGAARVEVRAWTKWIPLDLRTMAKVAARAVFTLGSRD